MENEAIPQKQCETCRVMGADVKYRRSGLDLCNRCHNESRIRELKADAGGDNDE